MTHFVPVVDKEESQREAALKFHHDAITDIALLESPQPLMLTASRDGVIKVWK
jgi:hypothetical protein